MGESRAPVIEDSAPVVPFDLQIERALLGALLIHGERIADVKDLEPAHFYRVAHRLIFAAMRSLQSRGVIVDFPTVRSELGQAIDDVGGAADLSAMADVTLSSAKVSDYAKEIRMTADAREIVGLCRETDARVCRQPSAITNGFVAQRMAQLGDILARRSPLALVAASPAFPELSPAACPAGLVGEIVHDMIGARSEVHPAAILASLLTATGCAVGRDWKGGRGPHFFVNETIHYCNLYTVIVARTGDGKGDSWSPIKKLFTAADPECAEGCWTSGLSSGEGLISLVNYSGPLSEGATTSTDKRRLVVETEFSRVLAQKHRDSNILSEVLRQFFDDNDVRTLTRKDPLHAKGGHVNVLGHITPKELRARLADVEIANGSANRFTWWMSRRVREIPDPQPFDPEMLQHYAKELGQRLNAARRVGRMVRDSQAAEAWASEAYRALKRQATGDGIIPALLARGPAQVVRFSMIYALLDGSNTIGKAHQDSALAAWDYVVNSIRYIFGTNTGSALADQILVALRQAAGEGVTRTQIMAGVCRGNRSADEVDDALSLLQGMGLAHSRTIPQPKGAPLTTWFGGVPAALAA